jgi:hypothetical protein
LFSLLGMAPLSGFLVAGLRDLVYKLRRGEELSFILLAGLVGSLMVQSVLFPFFLAFLAAKQAELYFGQGPYPWEGWVKAVTVLHLIVVFMVVVLALIGGFIQFESAGFRALLGTCAGYWMFSFLGVIGLYGKRRDYTLGGMILAGVVALLLFWVQVYPYAHLQRNWPERLVADWDDAGQIAVGAGQQSLAAAPYLRRAGWEVVTAEDAGDSALLLRVLSWREQADTTRQYLKEVAGWNGLGDQRVWVVEEARRD